eukprot:scaffold19134_cov62-Phaeocystis_antarctica.AAC.1
MPPPSDAQNSLLCSGPQSTDCKRAPLPCSRLSQDLSPWSSSTRRYSQVRPPLGWPPAATAPVRPAVVEAPSVTAVVEALSVTATAMLATRLGLSIRMQSSRSSSCSPCLAETAMREWRRAGFGRHSLCSTWPD